MASTATATVRSELIGKLAHPLVEVRTRAFRSLITKFNGCLPGWSVAALATERELLARVVGWFNDESSARDMQRDMLNLVAAFAADAEARRTMVDLGCVTFFRSYKDDADAEARPRVQAILDALLKVQAKPSPAVTPSTSPPRASTGTTSQTPAVPHTLSGRSVPAPDLALCAHIAQYCRTSGTDGCRFPSVSLCAEDEVLLSDLTVRLYRQVPQEAVDACMELEHALLRDFPAEVVLQRPALFQALVSLVQAPNHIHDLTVDLAAISTMTALVRSFRRSLRAYASANLTAASRFSLQEPKFAKAIPNDLSSDRSEGTAGQAYPGVPRSRTGPGGEGLSLSQACRCIVGEVLPLLRDARRVEPVSRLLREALPLLGLLGPGSVAASQEVDARTVSQYVHSIAKVIGFHGVSASSDPIISHVVMLAVSVLELRPPDTLSEASWPQSTLIFMGDLMLKESFCSLHPSFPLRMLPYLKALYPPAARRYEVALSVRKQLDCCVALFSRRQTKFALADLNAVMEASAALRYHCDAELVANFVLACADLCSSEDADQLQLEQVRAVLLAALKSPVAALRGHCYAALHQLVNVRKNGSPRDVALQALVFHPAIMRQLVTFGLHDSHLGAIPADFLREIMSLCTASELGGLISPSMIAVVAAVGGVHTGAVANALLDTVQQQLDPLARLKLSVSMLFHKEKWIRSEAATALRSDYGAVGPADEEIGVDPFQLGGGYFDSSMASGSAIRTMLDDSDIGKVIDVFRQSALASQLRRSAAEQLLCVCQDSHACNVVYHHDVWASIWKELSADSTLHEVCLGLIMAIVERLPTARSALSDDADKMQLLLTFAFHAESKYRALASRIFTLTLLRIEVLTPDHTELAAGVDADAKICVPGFVAQNFVFCFPVGSRSCSDEATNLTSPDSGITEWINATSALEQGSPDRTDQIVGTALAGFGSATSLSESVSHLDHLYQLCLLSNTAIESLLRKNWIQFCVRYLQAEPSSLADYGIISKVLQLVSEILRERSVEEEVLQPLRMCVEHLIGLLAGLTAVLKSSHEGDEPSVGWLHSDLRCQTGETAEESEYRLVVQRFRESVLRFLADFIVCEQLSSPESPTTAALLVDDDSVFLEIVCSAQFPGTGPLAFSVRSLALRCLLLVLRSAGGCTTSPQVVACLEFSRSVVCAAALAPGRYVDDQLFRVAMETAGQCLWMLQGSASAVSEEFVASTLEVLQTRNTTTRSAALRLLKDVASSAAKTETLKPEWENIVSFCSLGDRMVAVAMDADERFEVRGEALRVLADAVRYSVRMHDGSLHDGLAAENRHLTEHGLMSAGLELDTFHRRLLTECVQLLMEPTPPKFAGQLCEVLLWSALAFDHAALTIFCDESTWRALLTHLSISNYWTTYTNWQQTTSSTLCVPVTSRTEWFEENAGDLAAGASSILQLMRLMVLDEQFQSSLATDCIGLAVEATVNVLTEVFESKNVFGDDAFARVNQSSYELLSALLARTDEKSSASVKQALRTVVGQTLRAASRRDGSAIVDSLTECLLSAVPDLEIAVCQFLDVAISDASDLLMLHMTSAQCQEMTTALVAAHIEGPLCAENTHGNDAESDERWAASVRGALGQLLAWSHDAKVAALHAGLLGSIVDRLFVLHDSAHLALPDSKDMTSRANFPPLAIASIIEHLKLLTNFLHHSAEAKAAAADPACVHVQRKLWALQLQWREPCFTRQLLHVAAASVSHCADSQAQWHEKLLPTEHNADGRHILSAIIRLAKKRQVTSSVWLAAVGALRNFALIKSARLHMLKEGWLTKCSELLASVHGSARAKEQPAAVALVEFLANFTFAADGQVGCIKVGGMLSGIVRTLAYDLVDAQRAATLAIRNMCFHRANKPHLLASKEALPALGRALSSDDAEVRLNAASAVWALVYDSQKAKAEVKKLAAQGIIILAPSVIHAATKPVDPAIAAAAEAGGPEARAAFAMLQVARLSKAG